MSETSLASLAPDLRTAFPRSPRTLLAGFVVAARTLDKCRADLNGTKGEYHFDCPLDRMFFQFAGIDPMAFRDFVATGATDEAVAAWIMEKTAGKSRIEIIRWNNRLRDARLSDMPDELQEFLEDYIPQNIPAGCVIYRWFDVYDIEEKRM